MIVKRLFILHALTLLLGSFQSIAQEVKVTAGLDTNVIKIGGQVTLKIEVSHPGEVKGVFPVIADTFNLLEVIQRSAVDTVSGKGQPNILLNQRIVLTSFDSGFHVIPPVVFNYKIAGDTAMQIAESKPLLVTVQGIQVDTTRAIKDIKGQMVIPYTWQDFLPYIFGIIILTVAGILIYRYLKNRKSKSGAVEVVIPKRPAHEIALEELAALDQAKLWQQGNFKGYYTSLSDITRTFIENRWMVTAMEMTTDEILQLTFIKSMPRQNFEELKYLLEISDLAKFAKMTPVVFENEQCMKNAVSFVKTNAATVIEKEAAV